MNKKHVPNLHGKETRKNKTKQAAVQHLSVAGRGAPEMAMAGSTTGRQSCDHGDRLASGSRLAEVVCELTHGFPGHGLKMGSDGIARNRGT